MTTDFHYHRSRNNEPLPFRVPNHAGQRKDRVSRVSRIIQAVLWMFLVAAVVMLLVQLGHAGGPRYVAGASYFDPSVKGIPLTWSQGAVVYFTDQGNLSPLLPGLTADAFVADAFTRWAAVSTAALTATRGGQLSEDVSGQTVTVNPDQTINLPADIQATATTKPVGIVYDFDGQVTGALLGAGAGDPLYCFTNAAFGGPDNFSSDGHIVHALVVINGNCATTSSQLADLKYRLIRVLGHTLGLDWSQLNINVITRTPVPTSDDFNGFPLMHFSDLQSCVPISACYPSADQLRMDDRAAISRLYPVTTQNQANFPGKQLFHENTLRIHGSVRFADAHGSPAQSMQGVNVVARWIDPATGNPSRRYSASSVSGFLFSGNAGNAVNGTTDSLGQPYNRWGSDDPAAEGFFDLAGLETPDGSNSAQYQLGVEAIDTNWSGGVGPYAPWQVAPSGSAQPVVVTLSKGGDVQQDLIMQNSAVDIADFGEPDSYSSPAALPSSGDWTGVLSGYGDADYFQLSAQAFRTMSIAVTALDETGTPTENKARPIIGAWALADPPGTLAPASNSTAFNAPTFAMSRLDANLLAAGAFRIGIADERGDGRPDYRYHARVVYGDTVIPSRVSMRGGMPLLIHGLGFAPGMSVTVGGANAPLLANSAGQLIVSAPAPAQDGTQSLTITDPATGAYSTLTDVLTFGAASTDSIQLVQGSNPAVPVGGETPNPIRVEVTTSDGITPVSGASVSWSANAGAQLSACGGASTCTVGTDESGMVSTRATVMATGATTITATLAPASYQPPKLVQTTVVGSSSSPSLDISLTSQYLWVANGATLDQPLRARVLSNGSPVSGRIVNYFLVKGAGSFTSGSATTDANGYASVTLHLASVAGEVNVSTCVGPSNAPCQTFYIRVVAASSMRLQVIAGGSQMVTVGHGFQPVTVRVTDSATPPNPVRGAAVTFQSTLFRPDQDVPNEGSGESTTGDHSMPVILGTSQATVVSDVDGLAGLVPSAAGHSGALEIELVASTGAGASAQFELEALWPVAQATSSPTGPPSHLRSCTTAGCSAVSAPSGPRRGSRASSTESPGAAVW